MRILAAVLAAGLAAFTSQSAVAHDVRITEVHTPALPGTYYPIAQGLFAHFHHYHRDRGPAYVFIPSAAPVVAAPIMPCSLKDLERECGGAPVFAPSAAYAPGHHEWLALGEAGVPHERGMVRFGCRGCLHVPVMQPVVTIDTFKSFDKPRRPAKRIAKAPRRPVPKPVVQDRQVDPLDDEPAPQSTRRR